MYPIIRIQDDETAIKSRKCECDKSHTSSYIEQNDEKGESAIDVNVTKDVREFTGWSCTKQEKGVMIDL